MKLLGRFRGKKWFDLRSQLVPRVEKLHSKYRKIFEEEFSEWRKQQGEGDSTPDREKEDEQRMQKAAAWYFVTYDNASESEDVKRKKKKKKKGDVLLLSFAWVKYDLLCQIKKKARSSSN